MKRSCAIIGVVGSTYSKDRRAVPKLSDDEQAVLRLACQVGAQIAARDLVLLTGGHHACPEASVKYESLDGATKSGGCRVIGVLPKSISHGRGARSVDAVLDQRSLYVHTQLESHERNPLTGQAADVLIALQGGSGTAEEIGHALCAGRPVVFLDSWSVLKPLLSDPPADPVTATKADEAVDKGLGAIGWNSPSPQLTGRFPDRFDAYNPDAELYARLKERYEQELARLCPTRSSAAPGPAPPTAR